jgi:iron complex outermembrane receptor protein
MARLDWDMDWARFTSLTAYRSSDYEWIDDLTGLEPPSVIPTVVQTVVDYAEEEAEQFSQEFRLTGNTDNIDWVAGLYYMNEEVERAERFYTEFSVVLGLPFPSPGDVSFYQDNETDSYAVFGQLDWHITDAWDLTLGLRYSYDDKEITQGATDNLGTYPPFSGIPLLQAPYGPIKADDSWGEWTPKATLSYNFNDDVMAYATVARGYKSGAFASAATTAEGAALPADPELANNYEIGLKSQFWDNRAQFNILYFFTDYEDLQVYFLDNFLLNLANGEAESSGVELEYVALLTENFRVSGSYAYNDTEYTDLVTVADFTGNDLARAPEQSFTIVLDYAMGLSGGSVIDLQASYFWQDDWFHDPSNAPGTEEDDYGLLNASITWTSSSEQFSIVAWGKNLDDEEYRIHSILDASAVTADVYGAPRTYGLTVNYAF